MNEIIRQIGEEVEIKLYTDRPKIPGSVIRDLKLSPGDILMIKETGENTILVPLEKSGFSPTAKSKYEVARLKVGRDSRVRLPLDVLELIGGKLGGRLRLIRGRGSYQVKAEIDDLERIFITPDLEEKAAHKKRQANIKQITKSLTQAQACLQEAVKYAERLLEKDTDSAISDNIKQAIQQVRIANYFSV